MASTGLFIGIPERRAAASGDETDVGADRKPAASEVPNRPRLPLSVAANHGVVSVSESDPAQSVSYPQLGASFPNGRLAPISLKELREKFVALRAEGKTDSPLFDFYVSPASPQPIETVEDFRNAANEYFEKCFLMGQKPRLNGLALSLGMTGPVTLQRLAMRRPDLRVIISRCLTAVANSYEESDGGPLAMFMLKHIPEFDPVEQDGARPIQYFQDKKEISVFGKVVGVVDHDSIGAELSPREAYYKLIHQREVLPEDLGDVLGPVNADITDIEDLLKSEATDE